MTVRRVRHELVVRVPGRRVAPRIFVIGAQKAGTSAFFAYLSRHPAVARAAAKEVHYFDRLYARGEHWYRTRFQHAVRYRRVARSLGVEPVALEASPYYVFHPLVPARLRAFDPEAKLIVLLRDPVERAYSHWWMVRHRGFEPLGFADALAAEPERLAGERERLELDPSYRSLAHERYSYAARGRYAEQLERWYEHFEREQLLVLFTAELGRDPVAVMGRTFEFLELPPVFQDAYSRHGTASSYPEPLPVDLRTSLRASFADADDSLARLLGVPLPWAPSPE